MRLRVAAWRRLAIAAFFVAMVGSCGYVQVSSVLERVDRTQSLDAAQDSSQSGGAGDAARDADEGSAAVVPSGPDVLWTNDHETGSLAGWTSGGGVFNSGGGRTVLSQEHARSGEWSARLEINGTGGTRLFRWEESREVDQAYYSAWFYFPRRYDVDSDWWNIFQFKSKAAQGNDPFWVVNVGNRDDGSMYLYLHDWVNERSYDQEVADLPVGQWVLLEAYLDQSADGQGRLEFWQDGQLVWDKRSITTRYSGGDNQWSVNNYGENISPSPAVVYVDDAVISVERVWH